jgi:hypothetical protein
MNSKYLGHHKLNNGVVIEVTRLQATDLSQEVVAFYSVLGSLDPEACWLGDPSKPLNDKSGKRLVEARLKQMYTPGQSWTQDDLTSSITFIVKKNPFYGEAE